MKRTSIKNKKKKPEKKKRRVWLKREEDVRRLLSSTINELRREEIKPEIASKIGYLCNILLGVISTIKDRGFDERVQILEERVISLISEGRR